MKPTTVSCPSCGAPHDVHNPGVLMISCEYCGNAVYWDQEKVRNAGKQAHIPEGFTRLYKGATGSLFNRRFVVLGRARYSFGRGFWDEWYLEMENGSIEWLTEDNHELALEKRHESTTAGSFENYNPGQPITWDKKKFHVQETGHAECIGIEGELPKALEVGEKYPYVDASSLDGKYALSIEFDEDQPTIYFGQRLKHAALKLDEEGNEW